MNATSITEEHHDVDTMAKDITDSIDQLNISNPKTSPVESRASSVAADPSDNSNEVPSVNEENGAEDRSPAFSTDFQGETPSPDAQVDS